MLCLGNSLVTLVICIVCVLISIVPIKTSRRALQNSSGAVAEERTGGSEPEVTTKHAETTLPVDGQTQVKAMRMSALWPRSPEGRYHVIPYYVVEPDNDEEAANGFYIDEIFDYISKRTCVQFQRKSWKVPECSVKIHEPTVCIKARKDSDLCFSDATGIDWYNWRELNEAQILYMPPGWGRCPFHEGVQSVAKLLGLLPEHRRADRDELLRVMVTAAGSDQLLFAQGQTAKCTDYEDDSPLDLFSVSGFDTSASTLRGASAARMRNLEHGMVISTRNIRHQWILDYKRQRDMGLSFYDQRDIVRAYNCEQLWNCIPQNAPCENGGFRNSSCLCECPYGFGGDTCSRRTASGERDLNSKCTATVRSRTNFTLADIGLEHDGRTFYACDLTLMPPGCMRPLIVVNTSSLRTLRTMDNPDWQNLNFCELYFTLLLKHSVFGWRTYCLDYFFNEETLMFMPHASIEQTYAYMKMHAPSKERFAMIASITFSITFVEVPECSKKGATDGSGGASTKVHSYNVMTAVFSYFFGMLLVIVAWTLKRALFVSHDEYNIPQATAGSSGSSSYESMGTPPLTPLPSPTPTPRTPSPAPQPPPPPPDIRLPPPEWHVTDTAASDPSAADRRRSPSPTGRSPQQYPGDRPPQQYPGDRPPQPHPGQRPAPQQELHLPPIGGGPQQLSPRQGGLRASFMQWGGAALSSLRASFVGGSSEPPPPPQRPRPPPRGRPYPPQGRPRPPPGRGPPPGHRPPPQGGGPRPPPQGRGPRPPPQGGAYRPPPPQGGGYRPPPPQNGSRSPPPPRYKTAPSRPGPPRKGPT